jgi:pimeloyl-ACP methyl ester carboxylesterase
MFETSSTVSRDGTRIVFDRRGHGTPIIFVVGAFNERPTAAPLAEHLADRFTTFTYDRRGRGDSGNTLPYAVEREVEDLAALIEVAGGSACVFGFSSGAALALRAAAAGLPIDRLVLFDAPYRTSGQGVDRTEELAQLVAAGKRGEAVEYFQSRVVGIPESVVEQMRDAPFRPALERIAHTLVYELMILGDSTLPTPEQVEGVTMPTLLLAGGAGLPMMPAAASALAPRLPRGRAQVVPGIGHDLEPDALGPVLADFFNFSSANTEASSRT